MVNVMNRETYNRIEKMLKLREDLLAVEEDRIHGNKGYSVDEVAAMMRNAIRGVAGDDTEENYNSTTGLFIYH